MIRSDMNRSNTSPLLGLAVIAGILVGLIILLGACSVTNDVQGSDDQPSTSTPTTEAPATPEVTEVEITGFEDMTCDELEAQRSFYEEGRTEANGAITDAIVAAINAELSDRC